MMFDLGRAGQGTDVLREARSPPTAPWRSKAGARRDVVDVLQHRPAFVGRLPAGPSWITLTGLVGVQVAGLVRVAPDRPLILVDAVGEHADRHARPVDVELGPGDVGEHRGLRLVVRHALILAPYAIGIVVRLAALGLGQLGDRRQLVDRREAVDQPVVGARRRDLHADVR